MFSRSGEKSISTGTKLIAVVEIASDCKRGASDAERQPGESSVSELNPVYPDCDLWRNKKYTESRAEITRDVAVTNVIEYCGIINGSSFAVR